MQKGRYEHVHSVLFVYGYGVYPVELATPAKEYTTRYAGVFQ